MGSNLIFNSRSNEVNYTIYCYDNPKWVLFKLLTSKYRAMIYTNKFNISPQMLSLNNECIVIVPQNLLELGINSACDIDYMIKYNNNFKCAINKCHELTDDFDSILEKEIVYKNLKEYEIASIYENCNSGFNISIYSFDNGELVLSNGILDECVENSKFISNVLDISVYKEYIIDYNENKEKLLENIFDNLQQYYYNVVSPITTYLKELNNQCNIIEKIVKEKDINKRNELIKNNINIQLSEEFIKQWGGVED